MAKKDSVLESIEKLKIHLAIAEQNNEKRVVANLKRLISLLEKKLRGES